MDENCTFCTYEVKDDDDRIVFQNIGGLREVAHDDCARDVVSALAQAVYDTKLVDAADIDMFASLERFAVHVIEETEEGYARFDKSIEGGECHLIIHQGTCDEDEIAPRLRIVDNPE